MTDITAVLSEYKSFTQKLIEQRKKLGEEIGKSFHGLFSKFFELYPEIGYVTWTQYTPYFNDGDECTFYVHERYYPLAGLTVEEKPTGYDAEEYCLDAYGKDNASEVGISNERKSQIKNGIKELEEILHSIPKDIYKDVFEDHTSVLVTREGISTEEYDHE